MEITIHSKRLRYKDNLIVINSVNGTDKRYYYNEKSDKIKIILPRLLNGMYFVVLYFKNDTYNIYDGFTSLRDIPLVVQDNEYSFHKGPILDDNIKFINLLPTTSILGIAPAERIQSRCTNIYNLAKKLSEGTDDTYQKIKNIYKWVVNNITYNYDSLINNDYIDMDNSALATLAKGRGVCQGYANLTAALLRSQNIHSYTIRCYTIESNQKANQNTNIPNHLVVTAWCNNRWILMDPTWDSRGVYEDKTHEYKDNKDDFLYFDNTIEFISNTHKYLTRL